MRPESKKTTLLIIHVAESFRITNIQPPKTSICRGLTPQPWPATKETCRKNDPIQTQKPTLYRISAFRGVFGYPHSIVEIPRGGSIHRYRCRPVTQTSLVFVPTRTLDFCCIQRWDGGMVVTWLIASAC